MERILLVEDDSAIYQPLTSFLRGEGFAVRQASGQREALALLETEEFDLVLLDVGLRDGNGFSVCSAVKQRGGTAVIFLSASGDEYSVVTGLDLGADDYIAKPFRPRELVSRIRSVLRRTGRAQSVLDVGPLRVDTERACVSKNGQELSLSALEYRLLLVFLNHRGATLSRAQLLEEIWDVAGDFVNDNTLTVYLLTVEHLTKTYGTGENAVHALDDVSFSVPRGQFLAIIGPSGSGKSTLLHILGGVDRPTSGHVYMNGEDVYSRSDTALAIFRRREVGLIYQFYNLIPVLNVVENITLPVLMDGRKVNDARLQELLDTLGLRGREKHLPNQLSGGQQQRVSIGRALINAPSVVLADEPTGNLDRKNSQEIVELLKYSNRQYGQTLIVITHDESIALQADRVLAIEDGHIVRDEVIRK